MFSFCRYPVDDEFTKPRQNQIRQCAPCAKIHYCQSCKNEFIDYNTLGQKSPSEGPNVPNCTLEKVQERLPARVLITVTDDLQPPSSNLVTIRPNHRNSFKVNLPTDVKIISLVGLVQMKTCTQASLMISPWVLTKHL